mmetsp:Transcript_9573/g.30634  ORF Transcript_9573/g.30634 Transcript_9573/m.30634 type:complete len:713 (+) Transcript_9573:122-2260(+)
MYDAEGDAWLAEQIVSIFPPEEEEAMLLEEALSVSVKEEQSSTGSEGTPDPVWSDASVPNGEDSASEAGEDETLMGALAGLKRSKPLKMCEAFALLKAVAQDDPRVGLPVRSQASPLVPSRGMYYVVRRKAGSSTLGSTGEARPKNLRSSPDAVKVAFQSVLNAEAWWCGDVGVVSRPMSRGRRLADGGGEEPPDTHGYRGRMYTLVARSPGSEGPLPSKRRRVKDPNGAQDDERGARFAAVDVSVVHAWRASAEDDCCPSELFKKKPAKPPVVWDKHTGDLHVRGNLRVDGKIYGQLATEPFAADYAEWFLYEDVHVSAAGKRPRCGSVVQLRSPEQRLSLDTSGPGPVLIVSTKPAVAAGVPLDKDVANRGALVAFLGQVPVRCRGRVHCGDQLVPSGDNDGCAVSLEERLRALAEAHRADLAGDDDAAAGRLQASHRLLRRLDNLGVAMEMSDCGPDDEETLLCFVRWNHAVRREIGDVVNEAVSSNIQSTWQRSLVDLITFIAVVAVIVDVTLLVCTVFALQNFDRSPRNQAAFAVLAQTIGFTNFCLIILLFVAFARKHHLELKRLTGLVAFWIAAVVLAVAAAAALAKGDKQSRTFNFRTLVIYFVWKAYNIAYNIYICHVMAQFRATRAYSDRIKNLFSKGLKRITSSNSNLSTHSPTHSPPDDPALPLRHHHADDEEETKCEPPMPAIPEAAPAQQADLEAPLA